MKAYEDHELGKTLDSETFLFWVSLQAIMAFSEYDEERPQLG
jgi:hypothetical protein